MSATPSEKAIVDLLAHTQAMLELVQAGEWEPLPRLQSERDTRLRALFAETPAEALSERDAENLQQLAELDRELLESVERSREEAVRGLRELRAGQKGSGAYHKLDRLFSE